MKVWINNLTGRVVGYENDFPGGYPGLTLVEPPAVVEVTAVSTDEPVTHEVTDSDPAPTENRLALEAAYFEKYGKKPHPAMKTDKLKTAVEG